METLVGLAIVSILAVSAIPVYMNYETKARVIDGLSLAGPVKSKVLEYYQTTGNWPADNTQASLPEPTSYQSDIVNSITVNDSGGNGRITIVYQIPALGSHNTLYLTTEDVDPTVITWRCLPGTILEKFLPLACKN